MLFKNKIEPPQKFELCSPIKISLNKKPTNIEPKAKKLAGSNIVKGDSCIFLRLFFLFLHFPLKVLKINLHEYIDVKKAVAIPTNVA